MPKRRTTARTTSKADDPTRITQGLSPAPGARPLESGEPDPTASLPYGKKATPNSKREA